MATLGGRAFWLMAREAGRLGLPLSDWIFEIAPFRIRCSATASKFFRERAKLGALILPRRGSRLRARIEQYSLHVMAWLIFCA